MDFIDISKMRTTVRNYSAAPVEREKLEKILEAGRWAPTAVNAQPQRVIILDTPESLKKVSEFCTFGYSQKYVDLANECDDQKNNQINLYYGAPLVLLICYDKDACWKHPQSGESSGLTDANIVGTHMMLEAASLGLGSAWISYFDKDKARKSLSIPAQYEIVNMLYIGYPAENFEPNRKLGGHRKALSETCYYNSFERGYK